MQVVQLPPGYSPREVLSPSVQKGHYMKENIIDSACQTFNALDGSNGVGYENRNFSTLLRSISHSDDPNSLRIRLSKWCRSENGRYAWCVDNPINRFDPEIF